MFIIFRSSSSSSGFGGLSSLWPLCWQSSTDWPGCAPPSFHGDDDGDDDGGGVYGDDDDNDNPPCWQSSTGWPGCVPPSYHGDDDDHVGDGDGDDGDHVGDGDDGADDGGDDVGNLLQAGQAALPLHFMVMMMMVLTYILKAQKSAVSKNLRKKGANRANNIW